MRLSYALAPAILTFLIAAPPVRGHGFGASYDLPVPPFLYWIGGGVVVAISFVLISLFVGERRGKTGNYPRYNLLLTPFRNLLESRAVAFCAKLVSVLVLAVVIVSGLLGTQVPSLNFAPTLVWIIWWVGLGFVQALIGNAWAVLNPFKATFDALRPLVRPPLLRYPKNIGVFPALLLFLTFAWIELISPFSANPATIASLAIAYMLITWIGMILFGEYVWLRYGEAFSVFFGFLSMFAPTEVRVRDRQACMKCSLGCAAKKECVNCYECFGASTRREINLRPFAVGLLGEDVGLDRLAFVLLMLASVSFDGLSRTLTWFGWIGINPFALPSQAQRFVLILPNTLGLLAVYALFIIIYSSVILAGRGLAGSRNPPGGMAASFAISLLPIAMVYHFAHYSTYLFINGQDIVRLVSDPLGLGWNLFGTSGFRPWTSLNYLVVWHYQVALIVIGHIVAVYIAHRISLKTFGDHRAAVRSQYPMLLLMVMYTMVGLWLLSAPSVA